MKESRFFHFSVVVIVVLVFSIGIMFPLVSSKPNDWEVTGTGTIEVTSITELKVQVLNINGRSVDGAEVWRYDVNWNYLDKKVTQNGGWATWSPIDAGTYWLEVYYSGEYWGTYKVSIEVSKTNTYTLIRSEPYCSKIDYPASITGDESATIKIIVTNPNKNLDKSVKVRLILDRGKNSPYDFDMTSDPITISKSGGTGTFTFTFTPYTGSGTYYIAYYVYTWLPGPQKWELTDHYVWGYTLIVNIKLPEISSFTVSVSKGGVVTTSITINNPNYFDIKVTSFIITDYNGFNGKIEATNLPLVVGHGETKEISLKITDYGSSPGTYTIKFKLSGTP